MGMVNGVGPNNSTVKATRLVRSRKVPFNGPESSAPYVVVYFFCALVTRAHAAPPWTYHQRANVSSLRTPGSTCSGTKCM